MQDTIPVKYNTNRFRSSLEAWGKDLRFWTRFPTRQGEVVTVKTAVSAVSSDGAKLNMQELEGKSFASLKAEGEKLWEGQLSKFKIEATPEQRETIDKMVEKLEEFDDVQTVYTNMKPE